ncbi:MAG: threonine--tRNA ligase, partial [Deltaproteobacteria bacterium]|nr:threonine--tRNA ligase [Deltaproteobacteria bacterium]
MIRLELPGGVVVDRPAGTPAGEALKEIEALTGAVAARVNGRVVDLFSAVTTDATVEPVTAEDPEALDLIRHSTAHCMAQAVARYFGEDEVEFAIGPTIDSGFYYDFDLPRRLVPEDLPQIEKLMKKIRKERLRIERFEADDHEDAVRILREHKSNSRFKEEIIAGFEPGSVVSFYRQGEFLDMCTGPHLPSTGRIAQFKLLSIAGAYWRGDEKREQLQRIYGTAFFSKEELARFVHLREEAERRDHRKLGIRLGLFRVLPEAPGFPFWMPKGTICFNELTSYIRGKLDVRGYHEIRTPHILIDDLWKRSGHYDHYKDDMYFTEIDERSFAVKPMNCPGAALVYKQELHSYRELPLRLAEFGLCHRAEASGAISGMTRVRGFVQDDCHHFCREDQILQEVLDLIELRAEVFGELGMPKVRMLLATRPEGRAGTDEMWDRAEAALERALKESGADYEINEGDGAFYGPKIDFQSCDALDRWHQLSTIQVDFSLPEKFDLTYVAEDSSRQRPVMIHRAILGSMERTFGLLVEHYAGAFPLWLAPEQVVVIPISEERHTPAANAALDAFKAAGLRGRADLGAHKMGKKIREATLLKVPYILVIGDREADSGTVSVRRRDGTDCGSMSVADAVAA